MFHAFGCIFLKMVDKGSYYCVTLFMWILTVSMIVSLLYVTIC